MANSNIELTSNTINGWIAWGASQFIEAELFFGHGTDNASDEALMLILHALSLDYSISESQLDMELTNEEAVAVKALLHERIATRKPAAYITGSMNFAGLNFYVTEDVLVPRSPIAELIYERFSPWVNSNKVLKVLDLCTGSGCIGIACAYAFPAADVDLLDISEKAIKVAQCNIQNHELIGRVEAIESDVYEAIDGKRYDIIVTNPPYVSTDEYNHLPLEYKQEPKIGLECGDDGMDVVSRILADATNHLNPEGILVVEVGASASLLMAKYPAIPFMWLDFSHGGDGVFMLTAEQLIEHQAIFI